MTFLRHRCGFSETITTHEMCVGADPNTELVQLVVFPDGRSRPLVVLLWPLNQDGAEESWALGRIRQVKRLRLSRTGRNFRTGTPSTNSNFL